MRRSSTLCAVGLLTHRAQSAGQGTPCARRVGRPAAPGAIALLATVLLAVAFGAIVLAAETAGPPAADVRRPKKLIAVGWDLFFDTAWLRAHRDDMEQRPFDGIVINVVGRREDKKAVELRLAFSREPWKAEWFAGALEDLKACRFTRLTDNFLMVWANPGDVDWFDDAGWREVVEHWRIAARLAKAAGARGIVFDPEPYHEPYAAFTYGAQSGRDAHPFEAYHAKARQRGREVMKAVAGEYPDITILSFFLGSICGSAAGHADPRPLLAARGYGLLPAFLDGWLDAAPPGVTMVDGHESSYLYNSDIQFLEAGNLIRGACQELVSPENRATYRAQVQAGFGLYLDAYVNPPASPWYVDGKGGPRVDRLRANVAAATRVADQYVWIYGEKCRWWPTPNKGVTGKTWPEALPGCEDALRWGRSPEEAARFRLEELRKAGRLANLLAGGDFAPAAGEPEPKEGRPPTGWATWQDDKSKGAFAWDREAGAAARGSARLAGMADGCFLQKVKVEPGRRFAVEGVRRLKGRGDAVLVVRWQTPEGKWIHEEKDVHVPCTEPRGVWGRMLGVVQVPDGAGNLVILLLARGQPTPDDAAWFDDVRLYALD